MPSKADRLSIGMMIAALGLVMVIPALSQETRTVINQDTTPSGASQTPSANATRFV